MLGLINLEDHQKLVECLPKAARFLSVRPWMRTQLERTAAQRMTKGVATFSSMSPKVGQHHGPSNPPFMCYDS
jgi:hypothetical protein